jgi:hypothetical protein
VSSTPLFPVSPLERVSEGMTVVDEEGNRLGRVGRIFLGYPDAVEPSIDVLTPDALGLIVAPLENPGGTTSVGAAVPYVVRHLQNDPDLPDELRQELLRAGYIELDTPGRRGAARYIHGDQVIDVTDDVVRVRRRP